jgi:predicted RNase H-like nuclease (RuvC/YqgF family)
MSEWNLQLADEKIAALKKQLKQKDKEIEKLKDEVKTLRKWDDYHLDAVFDVFKLDHVPNRINDDRKLIEFAKEKVVKEALAAVTERVEKLSTYVHNEMGISTVIALDKKDVLKILKEMGKDELRKDN